MGWALAMQGGGGNIPRSLPPDSTEPRLRTLRRCLDLGAAGRPALDVVELVVRYYLVTHVAGHAQCSLTQCSGLECDAGAGELENCPHFNAGRGSVLTADGTVEMEACIMEGRTLRCGAVAGVSTVVNPISLARRVMEETPHIYLAFHAAEAFARDTQDDPAYFITDANVERLKQEQEKQRQAAAAGSGDSLQTGTVGCVAVDAAGGLASATSTGGHTNKWAGRIGDTPIVGAGTYANAVCAVSATGVGEAIIRHTVARDVAAVMEHRGLALKDAAPPGTVGMVAVSAQGEVAMLHNTAGMFRACVTQEPGWTHRGRHLAGCRLNGRLLVTFFYK